MVGYESIGVGREETGTWYGPIHGWCSHCPMSTIPVDPQCRSSEDSEPVYGKRVLSITE